MTSSGTDAWSPILPHRAAGYRYDGDTLVHAPYHDMTLPIGGGSLYSTVSDLLRWDRALYGDKLLSKASLQKMFTPERKDYAYGWLVQKRGDRNVLEHGGGINGFVTMLSRYPDDQTLVAVLSNVEGSHAAPMSRDLAAIAFGDPYEVPKTRIAVAVAPEALERYVGKYQGVPNPTLTVTREGSRLFVQMQGQPRLEVLPESESRFFLRREDRAISFVEGPDGKITQAILHGGKDQEIKKIE
jgi:hypothetical protein